MTERRVRNLVIGALALALLTAAGQAASRAAQQPQVSAAQVGSKITYQGQLADASGNPLSGSHSFKFELYDAASAGTKQWEQLRSNVQVQAGIFSVQLDVDANDFDGRALWLAITVDGQLLSPRQELTPAPYALGLRPGARVYGDLPEPALEGSNAEGAGVGGHSDAGYGVVGHTDGDSEWQAAGVAGFSVNDRTFGVYGSSERGIGVEGSVTDEQNRNPAVVGLNTGGGAGVDGYGASSHGVMGSTDSATAYGGRFQNNAAGGAGAFVAGNQDADPDLVLGGPTGVIASDPNAAGGMQIRSGDYVSVNLDQNNDDDADFSIWSGTNDMLFRVAENGDTTVAGDLSVAGRLHTQGPSCTTYDITQAGAHTIEVPDFCIDGMCWITVLTDGTFGAYGPGLSWPSLYWQSASGEWSAGPNASIGGVNLGGGPGRNGDSTSTQLAFRAQTAGGGALTIWDDFGSEHSPNLWTVEFTPKAGELSYAKVIVCPMGQP
jgi:hypothetical protein